MTILLTPFCATPLNGNHLALFWSVRLPMKFELLYCLSTKGKPVKIFMNFRRNYFRLLFILEQFLIDFIASLNLSELAALGDKTFNEDTMISKLSFSLYEGFDHFQTSWKVTPNSKQILPNFKKKFH